MSERTVLVTGSLGFVGLNMVQTLRKESPEDHVVGVDILAGEEGGRVADLADADVTRALISELRPDRIFHLAGPSRFTTWDALYEGNVAVTITLLEAVADLAPECRVVVPGSAAEYGHVPSARQPVTETEVPRPVTPYGVAKTWQTTAALFFASRGVQVTVGRMFNLLGPRTPESLLAGAVVVQLRRVRASQVPPELRLGNLGSSRDFLDVADACRALIALGESGVAGEAYNVCSGTPVLTSELVRRMVELSGVGAQVIEDESRPRGADVDMSVGSNVKIAETTAWKPAIDLDDAIKRTLDGSTDTPERS